MKRIHRVLLLNISFTICIVSCDSQSNKITVENFSNTSIDSVKIFGNVNCDTLVLKDIKATKSKVGFLRNCEKGKESGDGSYQVTIYANGRKKTSGFGYFSNGMMFFEEAKINFTKQKNIIISFK